MKTTLFVLGCVCALAARASAQVTKTSAGYLLRAHYAKGTVIRLQAQMSVTGLSGMGAAGGGPVGISPTEITLSVLSVENGLAHLKLSLGAIRLGGTVLHPAQTAVVALDSRNQGVSTADGAAGNVATPLPRNPVHVGQTWTSSIPVTTGLGPPGKLNATYKFVGIRTLPGGPAVAVLSFTVANMASGKGTMMLLVKDGTIYSSEINLGMSVGETSIKMATVIKRK